MLVVNHPRGYYHHPLTSDTVAVGLWMHTIPLVDGFDPDRAAEYGVIGESECSCGIDIPHPIPDGDDCGEYRPLKMDQNGIVGL